MAVPLRPRINSILVTTKVNPIMSDREGIIWIKATPVNLSWELSKDMLDTLRNIPVNVGHILIEEWFELLSSALAFHPIHRFEDYTMIDID
jgi:hypothetical protein